MDAWNLWNIAKVFVINVIQEFVSVQLLKNSIQDIKL
jgi:hypothetical protein